MKTTKPIFVIFTINIGIVALTFGNWNTVMAAQQATAFAIIENGSVKEIKVTDEHGNVAETSGGNYQFVPSVKIIGGGGTGAIASATMSRDNDSGDGYGSEVKGVEVLGGGSGYTNAPQVVIAAFYTTNEPATAIARVKNGSISEIKIVNHGTSYPNHMIMTGHEEILMRITGGGGTGAIATASLWPIGSEPHYANAADNRLDAITIKSGGSGYTSAPLVDIETPQAATARVKALVENVASVEAQALAKTKKENIKFRFIWFALPTVGIGSLLLVLKKFSKTNTGKEKNRWLIIMGATAVCIVLAAFIAPTMVGNIYKSHPTSGDNGSYNSGSHKSARQLIKDYAADNYGRNADVEIESGFAGGAFQVTVKTPISGGVNDGGIQSYSYTVTVDESAQEITSWKMYDHN